MNAWEPTPKEEASLDRAYWDDVYDRDDEPADDD